jgi:hypothetical protein
MLRLEGFAGYAQIAGGFAAVAAAFFQGFADFFAVEKFMFFCGQEARRFILGIFGIFHITANALLFPGVAAKKKSGMEEVIPWQTELCQL